MPLILGQNGLWVDLSSMVGKSETLRSGGGRMGGGVGWGEGSPRSPGGGRVRGMEGIGFLLLNYLSTEVTTILRKKIS